MPFSFVTDGIKDPIRLYGPSDPYYWEVDNLPLEDLLENCARLQSQLYELEAWNFDDFATVGELEATFVKKLDFNARRLESLEEDFNFAGEYTHGSGGARLPENDDILLFNGDYHVPGTQDLGGRWEAVSRDSRLDLFPKNIEDLHDVESNISPGDGQVLKWDSATSRWDAADDIEYPTFDTLLDCEIGGVNTLATDDLLVYATDSTGAASWINGYPTNLPTFDNFSSPNPGDIFIYGGVNPGSTNFEVASLGSIVNQTIMFDGDGVEVVGDNKTVTTGSTLDTDVPWLSRFYDPGDGYSTPEWDIPNTTYNGGTDFTWSQVGSWTFPPRWAYLQGYTSVNTGNGQRSTIEVAFFDHDAGQGTGTKHCNYIHVNSHQETSNPSTERDVHRSFSCWVPIFWKTNTKAQICTGIYHDKNIADSYDSEVRVHVRCLGVRT